MNLDFQNFKQAYNKAVQDGRNIFIFQGKEFLVPYAKYLIEYMEQQLSSPAKTLTKNQNFTING